MRGGARKGAGRKPSPDTKVQMSVYVNSQTRDYLRTLDITPGSILDDFAAKTSK